MLKLKLSLTLLFLLICVACSTTPTQPLVVDTQVIKVYPPPPLLGPPEEPILVNVATVDDILANSDAFKLAYQKAVRQIERIRKWVEDAKNEPK